MGKVWSWERGPEGAAAAKGHAAWLEVGMAVDMAPVEVASHKDAKRSEQWQLLQLQLSALASAVTLQ